MDELPLPEGNNDLMAEVVAALNQMRDSLVKTSLLLQDYRFEIDTAGSQQANEATRQALDRSRSTS